MVCVKLPAMLAIELAPSTVKPLLITKAPAGPRVSVPALMFTRHGDNQRRFGDVQDNAMYWNFVVLTWLPIYACLYWVPRL